MLEPDNSLNSHAFDAIKTYRVKFPDTFSTRDREPGYPSPQTTIAPSWDYQPPFGLRRVLGKGGHQTTVLLPELARAIVRRPLRGDRAGHAEARDQAVTAA